MAQLLMRAGAAEQDPDAAGMAQHHRPDQQQGQGGGGGGDAVRTGRGEHRAFQCQAAHPLDQGIGQSRQQLPELVRPETVTRRPIGKEIQRLILEAVLHVPACAVHPVVEIVVGPRQVGDHEARIGTPGGMFGFHNHPSLPVPRVGPVAHRTEQTLLLARGLVNPGGSVRFSVYEMQRR